MLRKLSIIAATVLLVIACLLPAPVPADPVVWQAPPPLSGVLADSQAIPAESR